MMARAITPEGVVPLGATRVKAASTDPTDQLVLDAGAVGHGDVVRTHGSSSMSVALNVSDIAERLSARLLPV